MEYKKEQRIL